ncbi:MAG: hypothetical protein PGN08_12015 [Sphingomonas taxi]
MREDIGAAAVFLLSDAASFSDVPRRSMAVAARWERDSDVTACCRMPFAPLRLPLGPEISN